MTTTHLFFLANILYCLAYLVRDIFWLRVITVIAAFATFPYFFFQLEPLWSALFWQSAFALINIGNLIHLIYTSRPVALSDEQSRLHSLVFSSLQPREMLRLLDSGERLDVNAGTQLLNAGDQGERLLLVVDGILNVQESGRNIAYVKDGQFVGEMSFLTGKPVTADVFALEQTRLICWNHDDLRKLFERHRDLRHSVGDILGVDLAQKLHLTNALKQAGA